MQKNLEIYVCDWGYEQTNIDYYLVIKKTTKSVWLQKIGKFFLGLDSPMSAYVMPDPTVVDADCPVIMSRIGKNDGWIKIGRHYGYRWDGKKQLCSWWA